MSPWLLDALGLPSSGPALERTLLFLLFALGGGLAALAWRVRARRTDVLTLGSIAAAVLLFAGSGLRVVLAGESWLGPSGLRIPTYGFLIALGAALAIWLSWRDVERIPRGILGIELLDLYFWLIVGGIGGARLLYVLTVPGPFVSRCFDGLADGRRDCFAALRFWEGGLVFWGGVIGCMGVLWLWTRRHGRGYLSTIDRIVPWGPLGHALGRVGCIGAGCCFGDFCDRPERAIVYPEGSPAWEMQRVAADPATLDRMMELGHALPVVPVQLWEALAELVIFALLVFWIRPRTRGDGWLLGWWMVLYSPVRFVLELYRGDATRGFLFEVRWTRVNEALGLSPDQITLLSTSQCISLGGLVAGVALLLWVHRAAQAPLPDPSARRPRGGRRSA